MGCQCGKNREGPPRPRAFLRDRYYGPSLRDFECTFSPEERADRKRLIAWFQLCKGDTIRAALKDASRLEPIKVLLLSQGVPSRFRAEVWRFFLGVSENRSVPEYLVEEQEPSKNSSPSRDICRENHETAKKRSPRVIPIWARKVKPKVQENILKDLKRTYPDMPNFTPEMHEKLSHFLHAYSCLDRKVGYCQGMNFIAGFLLTVLPNDEHSAFWIFCELLTSASSKWNFAAMYKDGMPLLKLYLFQLEGILGKVMPELTARLKLLEVSAEMYAIKWLMTLFTYSLPFETVCRLWDFMLVVGPGGLTLCTCGIIKLLQKKLLTMEALDVILPTIIDAQFPAEQIIQTALSIHPADDGKKTKRRRKSTITAQSAFEVVNEMEKILERLKAEWIEVNPQLAKELGVKPLREWDEVSSVSGFSKRGGDSCAATAQYLAGKVQVPKGPTRERDCASVPHAVNHMGEDRRIIDDDESEDEIVELSGPFEKTLNLKGVEDLPHWSDTEAEGRWREGEGKEIEAEAKKQTFRPSTTSAPRLLRKRAQKQAGELGGDQQSTPTSTRHKRTHSEGKDPSKWRETNELRPKSADLFKNRRDYQASYSSTDKRSFGSGANSRPRSVSVDKRSSSISKRSSSLDMHSYRSSAETSRPRSTSREPRNSSRGSDELVEFQPANRQKLILQSSDGGKGCMTSDRETPGDMSNGSASTRARTLQSFATPVPPVRSTTLSPRVARNSVGMLVCDSGRFGAHVPPNRSSTEPDVESRTTGRMSAGLESWCGEYSGARGVAPGIEYHHVVTAHGHGHGRGHGAGRARSHSPAALSTPREPVESKPLHISCVKEESMLNNEVVPASPRTAWDAKVRTDSATPQAPNVNPFEDDRYDAVSVSSPSPSVKQLDSSHYPTSRNGVHRTVASAAPQIAAF
eukprot:GEMP01004462.1.p1 GENE.GEMP01004462.1~~GEMP01004462.1.p1  ORF type:complete len:916 (+),score=163.98 GEMP01004462.1:20-2767(+)